MRGTVEPTANAGNDNGAESDFSPRKIKVALVVMFGQMLASTLLPLAALSLIIVPLTDQFHWTRTEFSFAISAVYWVGAVAVALVGLFADARGLRAPIMICTAATGVLTFSLAFLTDQLWQLYLTFGAMGLFGAWLHLGYAKIIGALFTQHRGKALAVFGVESTIVGAGLPLVLAVLIEHFGWRGMFAICGVLTVAYVPVLFLMLDEPGTLGEKRKLFLRPAQARDPAPAKKLPELEGLSARVVLRDRVFWLIVLGILIGNLPRNGITPHLVPMVTEKGFTTKDAVFLLSFLALVAPLGTIVAGWLLDKINSAKIAVPFKALSVVGLLLISIASTQFGGFPLLMLAIALLGFSLGTARPMGTYFNVRFFGLKAFGFYHGLELAIAAVFSGLAPPLVGYVFDKTGNYTLAYYGMGAALFCGTLIYLMLGPYRFAAKIGTTPATSLSVK